MVVGVGRGRTSVEISIAFTAAGVLFLLLRLYTRFCIVRHHAIEDYLIILAMICSIGFTICIAFQAKWGMGEHLVNIPPDEATKSLKAFYASLLVYYLSLGFTKSSILFQYLRLFPTKRFQIMAKIVLAVVVAYSIYTLFTNIFICFPPRAFWNHDPLAKCVNQFAYWFTNAAINILTDFAIIILPLPVIRQLNLPRRQKQALIGVFAIGFVVCIVSILRLQSLIAISNSADPTYDNPPAATWTSVEVNVGIICSCLPMLKSLVSHYFPNAFTTSKSRSANLSSLWTPDSIKMESKAPPANRPASPQEIEVVTDIQVQFDEQNTPSSPRPPSSFSTPGVTRDIRVERTNSTEALVKDVRNFV